jgi:hypothetical protein
MLVSDVSPFVWAVENGLVTENQKPYEFGKHRFMIDPFEDLSPHQVTMKSAQVGWSVMTIFKSAWLADRMKVNVIYVLPSQNIVKDFVAPKVDPLITSNPSLMNMIKNGKDSVSIKQIGDRFIYFRGAFSIREAISISGDILVIDERDRCPIETVLTTYQSRLQASDYAWRWEFSNPSVPNFGVHESFIGSDQQHWFVKCSHCNHQAYMTFEHIEDYKTHYVDIPTASYKCGACGGDISDVDRKDGEWVAKYPSRTVRGYWVSQMVAPWVKASQLIDSYVKDTPEFFHNFVLGLPYIEADIFVNRDVIMQAVSPQLLAKNNVCIGVDNGVDKHYVIGTPNGIFKYGKTQSWEEIENLLLMYNAIMVIDANPYPNVPKRLVNKYPGRVFINYYVQDRKNLGIIRFKDKEDRGVVNSDRTKLMDNVANRIVSRDVQYALRPSEMEEYVYHWENTYRVVEEDGQGVKKGKWLHKEGKPDHYVHATMYYAIALEKALSGGQGEIVRPIGPGKDNIAPTVTDTEHGHEVEGIDLSEAISINNKPKQGWK